MKKLTLLLAFLPFLAFSQGIINDGGKIVITTTAFVFIDGTSGGYSNRTNGINHGIITLNGTMVLKGNWANTAAAGNFVFDGTGTGIVKFSGVATQTISGTEKTRFENLEVNNTAVANAVSLTTIGIDAEIRLGLTLTDGVITTLPTNKVVMLSTTAADLLAFSSASFVNGNFKRGIANNVSTYSFPVGYGGSATTNYYRMNFVNANLIGPTALAVKASTTGETGTTPFADSDISTTEDGTAITSIYKENYWELTPTGAATAGAYGLQLYTANRVNVPALADNKFSIVNKVVGGNYTTWSTSDASTALPVSGAAGRLVANGYAKKIGYAFGTFVAQGFAIGQGAVPLPITLTSFTANCRNNKSLITWTTASEINNDYFIVEKSYDGVNYFELQQVNGAGNSNSTNNYSITDSDNSANTTIFYRLSQVDYDGTTETFNSVAIQNCGQHSGTENPNIILLYPNPAIPSNDIAVQLEGFSPNAKIQLDMRDMLGKKLFSKQVIANSDGSVFSSLSNSKRWASGTYIVTTTSNNLVSNQKLLIK